MPRTFIVWAALVALPVSSATVAFAQPVEELTPQQKLLAKRAAELDAYRKLVEQIKGLQITSETSVRDFVTEYDEILAKTQAFIKGVKFSEPVWEEDGVCTIVGRIPLKTVITTLTEYHKRYYKGDKYRAEDFQKIEQNVRIDYIEAEGTGAPRQEPVAEEPEFIEERPVEQAPPPRVRQREIPQIFREAGPQARLMAKRAAEVDAYRKLAEQIKGVQITSETTVRDFVTESDEIEASLNTFIKGVKLAEPRYLADGIVEVDAVVTLKTLVTHLQESHKRYYKGNKFKAEDFRKIDQQAKFDKIEATGNGALRMPARQAAPAPERERIEEREREVIIESEPVMEGSVE